MKTLHILNGDATESPFRQAGLSGDVLVWREMLSEGQVPATADFDSFWQLRGDFLALQYGLDREEYGRKVGREVRRVRDFRRYSEITLWFEFDLFCQFNLLYLVNFFAEQDLGPTSLTLVSPGAFPGRPDFKGLGELNAAELAMLWHERIELTDDDLRVGQAAWRAYVAGPVALRMLLEADQFGQFYHLKTAIEVHLKRFPDPATGLGHVEKFWLNALQAEGAEPVQIMTRFWNEHPEFGFGDFQLLRTLHDLKQAGLVHEKDRLSLTDRGHAVLTGTQTYQTFASRPSFMGGVERFPA